MKKRMVMIMIILFLGGCSSLTSDSETSEETSLAAVVDEGLSAFDEVERLLIKIELELGLGNFKEASLLWSELNRLIEVHEMSVGQEARFNTIHALLLETQATEGESRIFSGSDAVALVINVHGLAPDGYRFVYHEIPSFVGSDGLGYYVFLIREDEESDDAVRTFFVSDLGRILAFE